ncbi:MAG: hypothetical protein WA173_08260 [Pseudomonas sp.]|uniref:hypothetical protein n=1 Tax=Pseudomonas sp. TaxID=306 RepID=UPI003BB56A8F
MNRDLKTTARVLGIGERYLRSKLKLLNQAGELLLSPRTDGRLFTDTRARWSKSINGWSHYGVVMVTEPGVAWLAQQLGITVTNKDAAA